MNTSMRDRFLGSTSFLRQAPDAPSGAGGGDSARSGDPSPSSSSSSAPAAAPASPSPSPSPAAAPPSSESAAEGSSEIDFDMFFGGEEPSTTAPAAPPASAAPKAPEPPAPATPAAPEPPKPTEPEPPKPAAAAPSPSGAEQTPQSPPLDPTDPASLARHLAENEEAMVAHVAKTMFAITDKEMEELETNVGEAIPKLLGKTFVKMQANMLQQIARLVPSMVQRTTEAVQKNAENEQKFFRAWPALDPTKHTDIVRKYAVTYRQMHPQASFEQMIQDLGPLVMMAAKVNPTAGAPAAAPAAATPKPQPFVPSTSGATIVSQTPVEEDSALAALDPNRD